MRARTRWLVQHLAETRNRTRRAQQLVTADDTGSLNFEAAAALVHVVQQIRSDASSIEDALARALYRLPEGRRGRAPVPVAGVGVVEVGRGRDRKAWDHEALVSAVLSSHLAAAKGEIPDPFTVARDWLLSAAHVDYWRAGALAALGLDVDQYCASSPGRLSVRITSPSKESTS